MQQILHLDSILFEEIKKGDKKIEVRLFDEKRQKLKIGDIIIFYKRPETEESIKVKIIGLKRFKTFKETYSYYSIKKNPEEMYKYYSKEDEKLFGVIAIEFKKISSLLKRIKDK